MADAAGAAPPAKRLEAPPDAYTEHMRKEVAGAPCV